MQFSLEHFVQIYGHTNCSKVQLLNDYRSSEDVKEAAGRGHGNSIILLPRITVLYCTVLHCTARRREKYYSKIVLVIRNSTPTSEIARNDMIILNMYRMVWLNMAKPDAGKTPYSSKSDLMTE
jgi:hypothetical protein